MQKQNLRQFAKKSIHIDLTAVWNPRDFVSIPSQNSNKPQPILMDMTNLNYIGKENKKSYIWHFVYKNDTSQVPSLCIHNTSSEPSN